MANTVTSPNMNLVVPVPSVCPGPEWAQDIYNCLYAQVDQHNHTSGSGVQIQPSGLNISSDLTFNNHNAISLKTSKYQDQGSSLASSFLNSVYAAGGNLYFNSGTDGFAVQITSGHSVTGSSGTITGLPSGTAGAAYNSGSATFIFTSATSTAANIDGGSIKIREVAASTNAVTLSSPSALASNYTLTFPAALPASASVMTVDNLGSIVATNSLSTLTVTTLNIGSGPAVITGSSTTLICGASLKIGGSSGASLTKTTINAIDVLQVAAGLQPGPSLSAFFYSNGNTNTLNVMNSAGTVVRPIVVSANPSTYGLMIVRGYLTHSGSLAKVSGEGFSYSETSAGVYVITFDTAFIDIPSVVCQIVGTTTTCEVTPLTTTGFTINISGANNSAFCFQAIGQRT